jgi:Secretion system C-terminal sorting domain
MRGMSIEQILNKSGPVLQGSGLVSPSLHAMMHLVKIVFLVLTTVPTLAQTYSITHDIGDGIGDIYKNMVVDNDTIFAISAHGCNGECMSVVKINSDGIILQKRTFSWMDEGDKDMIYMDGEKIVVCGSRGYGSEAVMDVLVLDHNLDSLAHATFGPPDSVIVIAARSITAYQQYYVVVGFGVTPNRKSEPGLIYWIDKEDLSLDTLLTIQFGDDWTVFTQAFVKDTLLTLSFEYDDGGFFFKRGFVKYNGDKKIKWFWESQRDSRNPNRGEDAWILDNGDMIIEHSVDNREREFRLISVRWQGVVRWSYDDANQRYGLKTLYHLGQAINGDILGCGAISWPWDPDDTGPNAGEGYDGGFIFRMDSKTGEMLWERPIIGYDSFGNFAGRYFNDIEELSNGDLLMCGAWRIYDSTALVSYDSWLVRTDSAGCVISDCSFPSFTTSTVEVQEDVIEDNLIEVSPNPVASRLRLDLGGDQRLHDDLHIQVHTMQGSLVLARRSSGSYHELDVSDLNPGLYVLIVYNRKGSFFGSGKFVKI